MKKILSCILAVCVVLSATFVAMGTFSASAAVDTTTNVKYADLNLSNRVTAVNTDGSDNTAIRNFTAEGDRVYLYSYNNPNSTDIGSTASNNGQKHITLEDADGHWQVKEGKRYIVNIVYDFIRVNGKASFQLALIGANSATEEDAGAVVIGGATDTSTDYKNWKNNNDISIIVEPGKNGLEAGDYLRLFFGGSANVLIKSVSIEEIPTAPVTKKADLNLSNRITAVNTDGSNNTALRDFKAENGTVYLYAYNNPNSVVAGSTASNNGQKHISLEDANGNLRVEAGKKYTMTIVYDLLRVYGKNNFQMALIGANSATEEDATSVVIGGIENTSQDFSTTYTNQTATISYEVGKNGLDAGDYLRLFFGGSGKITIKSVTINEYTPSTITNSANLNLSNRVQALNDDGSANTALRDFKAEDGKFYLYSYNNPNSTNIGSYESNNWQKHVTLEDANGDIRVDAGKRYIATINYKFIRVNGKNNFQMALVAANSATANDAETVVVGGITDTTTDYSNWKENQTISIVFEAGKNGIEAGDYLRLFFGGSGKVEVQSVMFEAFPSTSLTKYADLNLSNRVQAFNTDGSDNTALRDFTAKDDTVYLYSYNNPNSVVAGSTESNNWQKHITLEDANGHLQVEAGKKYRATIVYDYIRVYGKDNFQIALVGANSATENDANTVVIGGRADTSTDFTNWKNNQVLTVEFEAGVNGLEKGDYLRLFFGGSGKINIKSVCIEENAFSVITKYADLDLSNRVTAVNADGSNNTALRDFTTKNDSVYLYSYNNPNTVAAGSTASNNGQKHITLEDANGHLQVEAGKKYVVSIVYDILRVYGKNNFQMALMGANSATEEDANAVVIGGVENTSTDFTNWYNNRTLKVTFEVGQNGLEEGDYLRLFFGGSGKVLIKSVSVQEYSFGNDLILVKYVDGSNTYSEYVKLGDVPSDPKDTTDFNGWYRNEEYIGKVTTITEPCTLYAKRSKTAYTFAIDFDTQSTKDFYSETHTKSDWDTTGGHAELVTGAGVDGTDAMRLTYKAVDGDKSDYRTNPLIWLHDTNIQTGDRIAKRFNGTPATRYQVSLKYKVEETDGKSIQVWVGTRQKSQSSNAAIHDFGTGAWNIQDTAQLGNTITEVNDEWVTIKATVTAKDGWFPVVLIKTNNQTARSAEEAGNPFASILLDDITVTEVVPVINDTDLGTMDYEDYEAKTYESKNADEIIGNKRGLEVTTEANHTANGEKSLKLTIMSDSLQHTGNSVISVKKEALAPTKDAAYIVKFWVMSKTDIKDAIWGVNTVAGGISDICAKHQIEVRDKVDLKANEWTEITAYIPKLQGIPAEIGMFTVAIAANGQDGKSVYIDDINVTQIIDSEAIIFEDSSENAPFARFYQRAFAGQAITRLPVVTKNGYIFDGWFDETGKEYYVSDKFPSDATELKLYAKWVSTENAQVKNFTAGSFDPEIYDSGVNPYVNAYENSEVPVYGVTNVGSTQSTGWVKDSGMYGNGTAEYDGTLVLQNDNYNTFTQTYGRNAIALVNEDGSKFMVVKGQKYSIKYDYISGSAEGTSVIQPYISTDSGYGTFGYNIGQGLTHIAVHGTDTDYKTYQEYFVAEYTGYLYLTFTTRSGLGSQHNSAYHKVYVDNLEVKANEDVKKVTFISGTTNLKTIYGLEGDKFPAFDTLSNNDQFDGFYSDAEFTNRITDYVFTDAAEQKVYIKYKTVEYETPSDLSSPIKLDFEETEWLDDYYRQGSRMTYWSRGEATPEWQVLSDSEIAYNGSNYMKLHGYPTYWNVAKFMLYDLNNPSGTLLLEKGQTYRITLMSRCEDMYDLPNLTVTLENPNVRYISQSDAELSSVSFNMLETEYENGYMCYTIDITVPVDMEYLPAVAIRKNVNDLQTLYIDSIAVEKLVDYKVQFEENGGTEITDFTIQVHETIADPGMPFYEGYVFKGWFYDKELTKLWDFDTMTVESDLILYAKWEVEPPVVEEPEELPEIEEPVVDEPVIEDQPVIEEPTEEVVDNGKVPTLLDGDEHEYPVEQSGLQWWGIVLIVLGCVVALAGVACVIVLLIARKKKQ